MSYNPLFEASKALPVEYVAKELDNFAAADQELSRTRFNRSPPSASSVPSTEYEESEPPSPGAQLHDKERKDMQNSTADAQFMIQVEDEVGRIHAARDKNLLQQPNLLDLEEAAEANVKYRWIQQGIWDERWANQPGKIWKHELRDSPPPARPSRSAKNGMATKPRTKRKRQLCDDEDEYQEVVWCAVHFQDRQSSRPCYQFVYQLDKEREFIKMGLNEQDQDHQVDIDTKAYENLKSRWIRDGIWDDDWTVIPGTSWRHERPPKFPSSQEIFRRADAHKAARLERAAHPPRWYFMAPSLEHRSTAPLPITNRSSSPPVSLKSSSDPRGSNILELSSKEVSLPGIQFMASESSLHIGSRRSTRRLAAEAKLNANIPDYGEPQTKSTAEKAPVKATRNNSKKTSLQKQRDKSSPLCVADSRLVKMRTSANKGKIRPPTPVKKKKETINKATTSSSRRATAPKAMNGLTKAT